MSLHGSPPIIADGENGTGLTFAWSRRRKRIARLAAGFLCLASLWPSIVIAEPPIRSSPRTSHEPQTESPNPSAEELYRLGKEALTTGKYRRSIRLLEQAAVHRPRDVELQYWLGVAYWNREQGEQAIDSYRLAVELDPESRSEWSLYALENLAEVYTRTDHAEEATKTYRSALTREPRPEWIARIHNQIAELDLALGDYQPDDATLYNERGEIIGGVGPGRMHTNRNFEIARQTNDPIKEEKYYRLAIDTDPQMYQPYFNLGLALVHQGRYLEAIPWLEESAAVWKTDADTNPLHLDKTDAHAFLALCHLELGDLERARHHAQRALETGEANYWALLYAHRIEIMLGEVDEALAALESLALDNPEHGETLYALHLAYAAAGQVEKAREILVAAIDSIPDNHPWMVRLRDEWPPTSARGTSTATATSAPPTFSPCSPTGGRVRRDVRPRRLHWASFGCEVPVAGDGVGVRRGQGRRFAAGRCEGCSAGLDQTARAENDSMRSNCLGLLKGVTD